MCVGFPSSQFSVSLRLRARRMAQRRPRRLRLCLPSSTTTTTLVTTTTTIPVASTVPFEDPQEVDLLFDVTGIESGSIAGYAGAGTNHDEVATIHAGTRRPPGDRTHG